MFSKLFSVDSFPFSVYVLLNSYVTIKIKGLYKQKWTEIRDN